jgi:hypothetical protein
MSQTKRAHSVTVENYVRTKHSGGKNEKFIQEWNPDAKRMDHEIHLDFETRLCTIVHLATGNRTGVPFEQCLSWNPYSEEEMLEAATAPAAKKKAG